MSQHSCGQEKGYSASLETHSHSEQRFLRAHWLLLALLIKLELLLHIAQRSLSLGTQTLALSTDSVQGWVGREGRGSLRRSGETFKGKGEEEEIFLVGLGTSPSLALQQVGLSAGVMQGVMTGSDVKSNSSVVLCEIPWEQRVYVHRLRS